MVRKKLVTKVKLWFSLSIQRTPVQSIATLPVPKAHKKSGHEGEALVQPVAPEYTGPISANGTQESGHEGEAFVQPVAPEYTGPISANGTQEAGHEGEAVVQPVNPAYTGSINSDTTSAKGTQESGHEGEALAFRT